MNGTLSYVLIGVVPKLLIGSVYKLSKLSMTMKLLVIVFVLISLESSHGSLIILPNNT